MDEAEREKFKKLIETQINQLKIDINNFEKRVKPIAPDNAIGRLSRMEAINEKSIQESNLRQAKLRLSKLEEAQKRVNLEDFGLCTQCDEPIPVKRLQILPESTVCMECLGGT